MTNEYKIKDNKSTKKTFRNRVIGPVAVGCLALGGVIVLANGLSNNLEERGNFQKKGTHEAYDVTIGIDVSGRYASIFDEDGALVRGQDSNKDGRFDVIGLTTVPRGHELEKYGSIEALEVVYDHVLETGEIQ